MSICVKKLQILKSFAAAVADDRKKCLYTLINVQLSLAHFYSFKLFPNKSNTKYLAKTLLHLTKA